MSANTITYAPGEYPDLPPPASTVGVIGWLRANLFSSVFNTVLTLLALWLLYELIPAVYQWAFVNADWHGTDREACTSGGACWTFIKMRFGQFMYGFYPFDQRWRVDIAGILLAVSILWLLIPGLPYKKWIGIFALFIYPIIAFILLYGGFGLEVVETAKWGGLMLTLVVAIVGIVASLPLGILLALGRRSDMPLVRAVCVIFIEFWRGVPLITVLFMSSVMLPLFSARRGEFR